MVKDNSNSSVYNELIISPHGVAAYLTHERTPSVGFVCEENQDKLSAVTASVAEAQPKPLRSGSGYFSSMCTCYRCHFCCTECGLCDVCSKSTGSFIINPIPSNAFVVARSEGGREKCDVGDEQCDGGEKTINEGEKEECGEKMYECNDGEKPANKAEKDGNNNNNQNENDNDSNNNKNNDTNNNYTNKDDTNNNNCCGVENLSVTVKNCLANFEEQLFKAIDPRKASMGITYNR